MQHVLCGRKQNFLFDAFCVILSPMATLFLDLASHSEVPSQGAVIACCDDKRTLTLQYVDHRMSDDRLMPTIESVLKEAKLEYKDIAHIAVVKGPGGFTSLRMAVTLANVLADQLQIRAAGIHLSDLYRARVATENFLWLHSTKKTELFVRGFGSFTKMWKEPTLISINEFVASVPTDATWAGELIPDHRTALAGKNLQAAELKSLQQALPAFLASIQYEKALILPWYGRGW